LKTLLSWSGGKDSVLALREARRRSDLRVVGLLTTFSVEFDRVSMHGVRRPLLEAQAKALELPLEKLFLPTPAPDDAEDSRRSARGFTVFPSNASYEEEVLKAYRRALDAGIGGIASGDIFLEDLRAYRERLLAQAGLVGIFPLWKRETSELMRELIAEGYRAVVVCADASKLDATWAGRSLDESFLRDLPPGVDPCGENGEFHTFVFDGPAFEAPVRFDVGETVLRGGFWFCDLVERGREPAEIVPDSF
jgi:uncharacterized protein (TIGR00290 family)